MKKKIFLVTIIAAVLIVGITLFFFFRSRGEETSFTADTIKVGDYVLFGSYNDEPILWRCIDTENGVMLLSEYILCMKAYDAAENFSKKNGAECHSIEEDLDFGAVIARHRRVCFCYPIYGSLTVRMQGHTIKL
jgi:hypothetical protein